MDVDLIQSARRGAASHLRACHLLLGVREPVDMSGDALLVGIQSTNHNCVN